MRLRAWCWGDPAAPPVVLVHGAFDHGRTWDGFAPRLAELGFHVVAIDVRGHGDSGRLSSGHGVERVHDRLVRARPGVGAGVGHADRHDRALDGRWSDPHRCGHDARTLCRLVNLDGLGPPAEGFVHDGIVEVATRSLDEIDKFRSSAPRPWVSRDQLVERRGAINIRLPRSFLEHLVEFGTREVEGGFVWKWDPAFRTGVPDGFSLELILAQYRHITAPTLVLVSSEQDAWTEVHDEEAERRVAMLADGRLESVPGAATTCTSNNPTSYSIASRGSSTRSVPVHDRPLGPPRPRRAGWR